MKVQYNNLSYILVFGMLFLSCSSQITSLTRLQYQSNVFSVVTKANYSIHMSWDLFHPDEEFTLKGIFNEIDQQQTILKLEFNNDGHQMIIPNPNLNFQNETLIQQLAETTLEDVANISISTGNVFNSLVSVDNFNSLINHSDNISLKIFYVQNSLEVSRTGNYNTSSGEYSYEKIADIKRQWGNFYKKYQEKLAFVKTIPAEQRQFPDK